MITKLFLPLFMSQVTYAISTFIAALMVAHLGKNSLAAMALVSSVYALLCAFSYGVLVSINILVSRSYGAKNHLLTKSIVCNGMFLSILCSIPFIASMWFLPSLFILTGQNGAVIEMAIPYLHSLSFSVLPWLLLVVFEQFLIGLSLTRLIFWISVIQVPFEILANYILIFGKFGLPRFGIAGIGYGFTLMFVISFFVIFLYMIKSKHTRLYKLHSIKLELFKWSQVKELFTVGLPVGLSNAIEYLLFPVIVLMIGKFGTDALAAHQITRQFFDIAITIALALTQATTARVGMAAGAGDLNAIKLSAYSSILVGFAFMLIVSVLYITHPEFLMSIDINVNVRNNIGVVEYTRQLLFIVAFFQIFDCIRLVVMGSLRGLKDTKTPLYLTVLSYWIVGFPAAYLFAFHFHLGVVGIWYGLLAGIIIGAIILVFRLKSAMTNETITKIAENAA